ncbi:glycosyltransferase [Acidianus brierleyi]|uniref:Glycosyl transferase family 1 n=1 Tax=Acidianus brierleyi TaxID=41673 RepID=A0A2U9ID89_9CREN|nr:glycosyltransferase [Acidianus brierleyi]AWR93966.1 glycosyltransferase [Acidianus brierleyi]
MKTLVIMPPVSLTSESLFATSFLKILTENNEVYAVFPKGLGKLNLNVNKISMKILLGPIISPLVDLPLIRFNSFLRRIDFSANLFYSHLHLGLDLDYIIYPPGIFRNDRIPPYYGIKKIYFKSIYPFIKKLAKSKVNLCSSIYVKNIMKNNIGFDCDVVYPPVIPPENYETREKQNIVVGIGKFIPSKHWEEFIEIAKKVRQKNPTIKFKIIGGLNNAPASLKYYKGLKDIAGNDVELLTDVNEEEKWRIFAESKLVLHCMRYDNFGLGVAEAMYAGAVPIVYKSSGTWEDTIQEGKYGIGYKTIEEAKEEIIKIIEDEKTYKEYSEKAKQRATQFSFNSFRENIMKYLNIYLEK